MPDKILISAIDCLAAIGVTPAERQTPQRLSVDVEFSTDARKPAGTDSIRDAVDYAEVAAAASRICAGRDFHLIETLAEMIASQLLKEFPIPQVRVVVRKISPIADPRAAFVSVDIIRP